MGAVHVPAELQGQVAVEALKCATQLDGLRVVEIKGIKQTCDTHAHGKTPKWAMNMQTWGEAGVIKKGKDGKTGDRGIDMMFVGYPLNREEDSYRMWNKTTNGVVTSRDIIFLKQMFFAPAVKSESVELGDLSTMNNQAEDAVDEYNDDSDEDMGKQGDGVRNDDSEVGDATAGVSESIMTTQSGWIPNVQLNLMDQESQS